MHFVFMNCDQEAVVKESSKVQTDQLQQNKIIFKHLLQHLSCIGVQLLVIILYNTKAFEHFRAVIQTVSCCGPSNMSCSACILPNCCSFAVC